MEQQEESKNMNFLKFRPQPRTEYNDPSHRIEWTGRFSFIPYHPYQQGIALPSFHNGLLTGENLDYAHASIAEKLGRPKNTLKIDNVIPLHQRQPYQPPIWQAPRKDAPLAMRTYSKTFKPQLFNINGYDSNNEDDYEYEDYEYYNNLDDSRHFDYDNNNRDNSRHFNGYDEEYEYEYYDDRSDFPKF